MDYLSERQIQDFHPAGLTPVAPSDLARPLRQALEADGRFTSEQIAGRNFSMACVALEVTQRCNLDCTLCYLSDLAETIRDVPISELKRRIKTIHDHYGNYINVQITGGDPTLRSLVDLVEIVRSIKAYNMRASLFTNGIKASREMLKALSAVGLDDVVFHVDMTQDRKGFGGELELNKIRSEYIERVGNLPLRILFNTTVFDDNVAEIPQLVAYFVANAERISLASFQMQANTGRGVLRQRDEDLVSQQKMMQIIEQGVGTRLNFDMPTVGHPDCNKYTSVLKSGSSVTALYDDRKFFSRLFSSMAKTGVNWSTEDAVLPRAIKVCFKSPAMFLLAVRFCARKIWALRGGLLAGRRVHRISFFLHNFMDAKKLEMDRCRTCIFMVATANGPLSMCVHNAKRDDMLQLGINPGDAVTPNQLPRKKLKGRLRAQRMAKGKSDEVVTG